MKLLWETFISSVLIENPLIKLLNLPSVLPFHWFPSVIWQCPLCLLYLDTGSYTGLSHSFHSCLASTLCNLLGYFFVILPRIYAPYTVPELLRCCQEGFLFPVFVNVSNVRTKECTSESRLTHMFMSRPISEIVTTVVTLTCLDRLPAASPLWTLCCTGRRKAYIHVNTQHISSLCGPPRTRSLCYLYLNWTQVHQSGGLCPHA